MAFSGELYGAGMEEAAESASELDEVIESTSKSASDSESEIDICERARSLSFLLRGRILLVCDAMVTGGVAAGGGGLS